MQRRQILTLGLSEPALERLKDKVQDRGVWLRSLQQIGSCFELLVREQPLGLILHVGTDLDKELSLLQRVAALLPEIVCLVVVDEAHPQLMALAWDLGATYVLTPSQPPQVLADIVLELTGNPIANS